MKIELCPAAVGNMSHQVLHPRPTQGEWLTLQVGGGAGWGDPAQRPPADVARDLKDGLITAAFAARHYPQLTSLINPKRSNTLFNRPERFAWPESDAVALVQALRFGLIVSVLDGEPYFSYIPLLVDVEDGRIVRLRGHFARSSAHWRALQEQPDVTVIFNGPNSYFSVQWMPSRPCSPSPAPWAYPTSRPSRSSSSNAPTCPSVTWTPTPSCARSRRSCRNTPFCAMKPSAPVANCSASPPADRPTTYYR